MTIGPISSEFSLHFLRIITHLGDSSLLIAISVVATALLVWNSQRPVAIRFALAVAGLMLATVVLKVGFYAMGGDESLNVLSPSGHAGFSVTVYGCCAAAVATQLRTPGVIALAAGTIALLTAILASRVILGAHTPQEVVMGSLVGLCCVSTFLFWNPDLPLLRVRLSLPVALACAAGILSVWVGGGRFNAERDFEQVGIMVGSSLGTLSKADILPARGDHVRIKRLEE